VENTNETSGRPKVEFVSITKKVEKELNKIQSIDISISHIKDTAVASASILI